MIISKFNREDIDYFSPACDDLAEAKAAGVDWKANLMSTQGEMVCIRLGLYDLLCIGGNMGDQCWFVMDRNVDSLSRSERLSFRKVIMGYRDKMLETYPVLWNFVWTGNKSHIRFLKTIGAEFHEDFCKGPTGELFQLFTITRR